MPKIPYTKFFSFLHLSLLPRPNNTGIIHSNYAEWMILISVRAFLLLSSLGMTFVTINFVLDLNY